MNTSPRTRTTRPRRTVARAVAVLVPAVLVAASCGGDDDSTDDVVTSTIDISTTEDVSTTEPAMSTTEPDMSTTEPMTEDTTDGSMTEDTTDGSMTEDTTDSEAAAVLSDTLAGEGVDTFLTLLPLIGFDQVTDASEVTIFAPTDEAFTSLGADELAAIVNDPQGIVDILQAHVVEGRVTAADLQTMETVQPIRGEALPVTVDGDQVMIGDATVVTADIEFDGGIVHVIDDVLLVDQL